MPIGLSQLQVSEADPTFVFDIFTLDFPTGQTRNAFALVAACHLVSGQTLLHDESCGAVDYIHLPFDRHEVLVSDGLPTESFHPGKVTLGGLDPAQLVELFGLFPELEADPGARGSLDVPALEGCEARLLDTVARAGDDP